MTSRRPEPAPFQSEPEGDDARRIDARRTDDVDAERVAAILDHVAPPATVGATLPRAAHEAPVLRAARVAAIRAGVPAITWRGLTEPVAAVLDDGVDVALIARAFAHGDAVLVEIDPRAPAGAPVIVGVVQTRLPAEVELTGKTVIIDADEQILLRAGRAAVRLRENGEVEVVGSRITTLSRGLFRIVGRVLRFN